MIPIKRNEKNGVEDFQNTGCKKDELNFTERKGETFLCVQGLRSGSKYFVALYLARESVVVVVVIFPFNNRRWVAGHLP